MPEVGLMVGKPGVDKWKVRTEKHGSVGITLVEGVDGDELRPPRRL